MQARIDKGIAMAQILARAAQEEIGFPSWELDWPRGITRAHAVLTAQKKICRVAFFIPPKVDGADRFIQFLCHVECLDGEWDAGRVQVVIPQLGLMAPIPPYRYMVDRINTNTVNVFVRCQ